MKGVSFVTNDKNERVAVQIDIKQLQRHPQEIEDVLDIIVAESRRDDEDIPWSKAKQELKKARK